MMLMTCIACLEAEKSKLAKNVTLNFGIIRGKDSEDSNVESKRHFL